MLLLASAIGARMAKAAEKMVEKRMVALGFESSSSIRRGGPRSRHSYGRVE